MSLKRFQFHAFGGFYDTTRSASIRRFTDLTWEMEGCVLARDSRHAEVLVAELLSDVAGDCDGIDLQELAT